MKSKPLPAEAVVLQAVVCVAAAAPVVWLAAGVLTGPDRGRGLHHAFHDSGTVSLIVILATLAVTPLRRLTGYANLFRARRTLGLFACGWSLLHLAMYVFVDRRGSWAGIVRDLRAHLYIWVGLAAVGLMLPLAATSVAAAVRRMGAKRWRQLHALTYAVAVLAVLHFALTLKHGLGEAVPYAAAAAVLLGYRAVPAVLKARRPPAAEPSPAA